MAGNMKRVWKNKARTWRNKSGLRITIPRWFSAESRRWIYGVMAEGLAKSREVVPTVANRVIFEYELGGHRCAKAKGKGRGAIKFLIGEGSDCICSFPAVFQQKLDGFVAAGVRM